jgi:hypothetical protein
VHHSPSIYPDDRDSVHYDPRLYDPMDESHEHHPTAEDGHTPPHNGLLPEGA